MTIAARSPVPGALSVAGALFLLVSNAGCPSRDAEAQRPSPSAPPPAPTAAVPLAPSRAAASAAPARELHPIGGPSCIEMYSVCSPDGRCTSAPFVLDCGESGRLPSTGEALRCVCP